MLVDLGEASLVAETFVFAQHYGTEAANTEQTMEQR